MVMLDMPFSHQSRLPSRSYARTLPVPGVTISVRIAFFQTNGVDQLLFSSRETRQTTLPVLASRARR